MPGPFSFLDEFDLRPGQLWLHGAPPGALKTTLAAHEVTQALQRQDVMFLSEDDLGTLERRFGLEPGIQKPSGAYFRIQPVHLRHVTPRGELLAIDSITSGTDAYDGGLADSFQVLKNYALAHNVPVFGTLQQSSPMGSGSHHHGLPDQALRSADIVTVARRNDQGVLMLNVIKSRDGHAVNYNLDLILNKHPEEPEPEKPARTRWERLMED